MATKRRGWKRRYWGVFTTRGRLVDISTKRAHAQQIARGRMGAHRVEPITITKAR